MDCGELNLFYSMKKLFYIGVAGLILFEILNVYFIMPMPGSQRMRSIDIAYFLYSWRWMFRIAFGIMLVAGFLQAFQTRKWLVLGLLMLAAGVGYAFNFKMAADSMFHQPHALILKDAAHNAIPKDKLVVGIEINGQARAYPIQLIGYHHQVRDTLAGKPVMVTYCTVCRTGRVFEPLVNGTPEQFRLVGMDHFNAMFEDQTTCSWWRQANGEAITGKLNGVTLPEVFSQQTSLAEWLLMHPNTLIMQPDTLFKEEYDHMKNYDKGKGKSSLTKADSLSWKDKSWVAGIVIGADSKAFDWNRLKSERIINDVVGKQPVVLALASDTVSFFAFERPAAEKFVLRNDSLIAGNQAYSLKGETGNQGKPLRKVKAYQEFWHSWKTFHPQTQY